MFPKTLAASFPFYSVEAEVAHSAADWPLHEDERGEGETPPVKRKKSKEKKGIKKDAEAKSGNKESSEEYGGKKVKSKNSSKRLKM